MKFGFCLMSDASEIGFFSHAEALGYSSVWVADSQMLFSDCYAVLALAARQTSRLPNRTGHRDLWHAHPSGTGRRDGDHQRPRPWAGLSRHRHRQHSDAHHGTETHENGGVFRVSACPRRVAARRDGRLHVRPRHEAGEIAASGEPRHAARSAHPALCLGFWTTCDGARGEHGDGIIFAIPPRGVPVAEALSHARQGAARGNRTLEGFRNASLSSVFVLEHGEKVDSDRVKAAIGPNVMASVYYFYDTVHERGIEPPPFLNRIWKPYCELVAGTPPEYRHFRTHELHYTGLHRGEAELIDEQLIRDTCLIGTPMN